MSNLLKNGVVFMFTLFFLSCSQEKSNLESLGDKTFQHEVFFEKVSKMDLKTSNENIIYIDFEWNSKDKTIKYLSSVEKEPDFFILQDDENLAARPSTSLSYEVSCDNGKSSWDKTCDGKWSCGKLIARCLDQGGCASICKLKMAYAPQTKTFYLNQ